MADSDKLDPDKLGEVDNLDTAKQAETVEGANVMSRVIEGGAGTAEVDLAEVDDASAKYTEEDVEDIAAKGSSGDRESGEAPVKGKRGKKCASEEDAVKDSSKKDGSSEEGTTEKGSKARHKQEESSAESSKKGSKRSSGNSEKGTRCSIEEKTAEKKTSSKEREPARVKGPQSPKRWTPLLVILMVVGLAIVVIAYVFGGNFPTKGLDNDNLFIGLGFILTGFLTTVGWK